MKLVGANDRTVVRVVVELALAKLGPVGRRECPFVRRQVLGLLLDDARVATVRFNAEHPAHVLLIRWNHSNHQSDLLVLETTNS